MAKPKPRAARRCRATAHGIGASEWGGKLSWGVVMTKSAEERICRDRLGVG